MAKHLEQSRGDRTREEHCDVLFVISSIGGGGAERKTALLASSLAERGHAVAVLTMQAGTQDEYELDPRVRRIELPVTMQKSVPGIMSGKRTIRSRIRRVWLKIRCFRKQLRCLEPAHVISLGHPEGLLSMAFKTKSSVHTIWTTLSVNAPQSRDFRYRTLFWLARLRKTQIVTQTEEIEQEYRRRGFTNLLTIPNPVIIPPEPDFERRVGTTFKIISVGRLVPQKSYETLLESLAILARHQTDWSCKVVGEGPQYAALQKRSRDLGLDAKVCFVGWSEDVRSLLRDSDAFVLTSAVEGQPNALLEAMSESLPCVSTDVRGGSARALLGDTDAGLVVPVGDTEGISTAIETLMLNRELRTQLGARSRSVAESFSLDKVTTRWARELDLIESERP